MDIRRWLEVTDVFETKVSLRLYSWEFWPTSKRLTQTAHSDLVRGGKGLRISISTLTATSRHSHYDFEFKTEVITDKVSMGKCPQSPSRQSPNTWGQEAANVHWQVQRVSRVLNQP